MKIDPIRQAFRPLFGLEGRETTTRFLYAILISALIINLVMIILRLLSGATLSNSATIRLLTGFLVLQIILLILVKRSYLKLASLTLVFLTWIGSYLSGVEFRRHTRCGNLCIHPPYSYCGASYQLEDLDCPFHFKYFVSLVFCHCRGKRLAHVSH